VAAPTGKRIPENRDEFDGFQHQVSQKPKPGINACLAQRTDIVNVLAGIQNNANITTSAE
jgi:hypothetical protein